MNGRRIDYLDMVKGIGIVLVVMGHSEYLNEQIRVVIASFHMPLFFIVSGMLLFLNKEEERPMRVILKKKARGMLVPYAVFSAVYLAIYGGYYYAVAHLCSAETIKTYLYQTFGLSGMSVLWFLTALFFSELAFLTLRKACKKNMAVTLLVCAVCAVLPPLIKPRLEAGFPLTNAALRLTFEFMISLLRSMVAVFFLMLGYGLMPLLGRLDAAVKSVSHRILLVGAGVLGLGLTVCLSFYNGITDMHFLVLNRLWIYYPNAFLGTLFVILICKYGRILRGVCYLGANSLIIMVTHLDCLYMLTAIRIGIRLAKISPVGKTYCLYFGIAAGMLVMELLTIYVVNHFLPFVIGKRYPKRNET